MSLSTPTAPISQASLSTTATLMVFHFLSFLNGLSFPIPLIPPHTPDFSQSHSFTHLTYTRTSIHRLHTTNKLLLPNFHHRRYRFAILERKFYQQFHRRYFLHHRLWLYLRCCRLPLLQRHKYGYKWNECHNCGVLAIWWTGRIYGWRYAGKSVLGEDDGC
jgi:hypothetical protein